MTLVRIEACDNGAFCSAGMPLLVFKHYWNASKLVSLKIQVNYALVKEQSTILRNLSAKDSNKNKKHVLSEIMLILEILVWLDRQKYKLVFGVSFIKKSVIESYEHFTDPATHNSFLSWNIESIIYLK